MNVRSVRTATLSGAPMSERWRGRPMLYNQRKVMFTYYPHGATGYLGDYLGKSWLKKTIKSAKKVVKSVGKTTYKVVASLKPLAPALAFIPVIGTALALGVGAASTVAGSKVEREKIKELESKERKMIRAEDAAYAAEEQAYLDSIQQQQAAVQSQAAGGRAAAPGAVPAIYGSTVSPEVPGGLGKGLPLIIGGAALVGAFLMFNRRK